MVAAAVVDLGTVVAVAVVDLGTVVAVAVAVSKMRVRAVTEAPAGRKVT